MTTTTLNDDSMAGRRPLSIRNVPGWNALAQFLAAKGVTPNAVSIAGLMVGAGSGVALAATGRFASGAAVPFLLIVAAVLILLRGFCNILDGMIAVEAGRGTRVGVLYNEVPDRLADAATMVGAGFAVGGDANLGWLAALLAVLISYARAQIAVAGAGQDFSGPMAKPMRMVLVVAAALYTALAPEGWIPAWGPEGAWGPMALALTLIIAGGAWTFLRRLHRAADQLELLEAEP
jgi:phosphatidylglycerophosphate synthase